MVIRTNEEDQKYFEVGIPKLRPASCTQCTIVKPQTNQISRLQKLKQVLIHFICLRLLYPVSRSMVNLQGSLRHKLA